jgi:hypothetical protein
MRGCPAEAIRIEQDVKATEGDGILDVRAPIGKQDAPAKKIPIERG